MNEGLSLNWLSTRLLIGTMWVRVPPGLHDRMKEVRSRLETLGVECPALNREVWVRIPPGLLSIAHGGA